MECSRVALVTYHIGGFHCVNSTALVGVQQVLETEHQNREIIREKREEIDRIVGSEVGIEEYTKNLIGISREFHRNCMYF
jgi:hypothetical protein